MPQAVEGDNWSAVIDSQTSATIDPSAASSLMPKDQAAAPPLDGAAAASTSSSKGDGSRASSGSRAALPPSPPQIVSPFMRAGAHRSAGAAAAVQVEMTVDSVDKALESVRPYLIADGGNVEVAAVENGDVFLRWAGWLAGWLACSLLRDEDGRNDDLWQHS